MAKLKVFNLTGKETGEVELSQKIFSLPKNNELIHQVYVSLLSNARQVIAHTKNRGERAGSGIKPWRQKGTGRARVGSVRTPLWRKGGVVFGPNKNRNFKKKVNQKMKKKALAVALSSKFSAKQIFVLENFKLAHNKTKEMARALKNLKIANNALLIFSKKEKELRLFSRNLKKIENTLASQLNVVNILNNKILIFSQDSLKELEKRFEKKA